MTIFDAMVLSPRRARVSAFPIGDPRARENGIYGIMPLTTEAGKAFFRGVLNSHKMQARIPLTNSVNTATLYASVVGREFHPRRKGGVSTITE